jgi:hypothetical protein
MSLLAISYLSKEKLGRDTKQEIVDHIKFIKENGIIPLLKSDKQEFEEMFNQAVRYYSLSTIQIQYSFGFSKSNIKDQSSIAKSFLVINRKFQNEFSKLEDEIIRSTFMNAVYKMEDYLLLGSDPKINVNKSKYIPLLEASFGIWVCILALNEVLSSDKYKDKKEILIKKCQDCTKILENYIMMIAKDHDRSFSSKVNQILEDIDSGKTKTVRFKNVDDYLKHLDAISVE